MSVQDNEFKIWLTRRPGSGHWVIRYVDPDSHRTRQSSTKTKSRKEAERRLGEVRADVLHGRHQVASSILWEAFRLRYENEVLAGLALKTRQKNDTVFDAVEELIQPTRLRDVSAERISTFQAKLREGGRAETTISGYLAHLRAALNWAVGLSLLPRMPKIHRVKRAKASEVMKGRPITEAEFVRLLAAVEGVVGKAATPSWEHYLKGLWWSGLRLTESLELHWDDAAKLCVEFSGAEVMLRIPAELEKGHKDRLLPMAPEFGEFLLDTPPEARRGRVFNPQGKKASGAPLTVERVSRIGARIGKAAKIVVDRKGKKFASVHDLRRSFGERWAERVMPAVLMELMRHESITTTLKYYVGKNAQRTAKILREAYEKAQKPDVGNGPRDSSRDSVPKETPNA